MLGRRLFVAGAGGGYTPVPPAPPFTVTGPYASTDPSDLTVLTQVHCHTTQSDGSRTPATIVADYLGRGFGALVITDHDKVTTQPAGITSAIPGNEHSPTTQHIIAMDASYTRGAETDAQAIVDGIIGAGGKAEVAHPNWYRGMTYAELAALTDYSGFEIHNGHCVPGSGQNPVTYRPYAVELWDQVLTGSRKDVWGFAVDDLHSTSAYLVPDMGRLGVFVESNTAANVMAAIASGNFVADVANFGITPGFPVRDDESISLSCAGATRIEAWGADGLLTSTNGTSHTHTFDGSEQYVRLVAIGQYVETFDSLPDRWQAVDGTWAATGGVLALSSTDTIRRIILRRHRQGDFTVTVDMRPTGGGIDNAALIFNVLNSSYYFMLRIGESSVADYNQKFTLAKTTSGSFGTPLDSEAFTITPGTWYRMKVDYTASTGRTRAKVWDRDGASEPGDWMLDASDTTWTHGAFGFRAGNDAEFDNLTISGFQTFYQPVAIG